MREPQPPEPGPTEPPAASISNAQPLETLLRRLAAICAAPEPPEAVIGTQRGAQETVEWLMEEAMTAARQCHAAAASDGDAGAAELAQASGTLAAAVEVTFMLQYRRFWLPIQRTSSIGSRLWSTRPLHSDCVNHTLQIPAISGSEGRHGARQWWRGACGWP